MICILDPSCTGMNDGSVVPTMTFAEAQRAVGGWVEAIRFRDGYVLVNEEGRVRGLTPNFAASALTGMVLVGPAVVVTGEADVRAVLGDP